VDRKQFRLLKNDGKRPCPVNTEMLCGADPGITDGNKT
jgi:hypothetical protein